MPNDAIAPQDGDRVEITLLSSILFPQLYACIDDYNKSQTKVTVKFMDGMNEIAGREIEYLTAHKNDESALPELVLGLHAGDAGAIHNLIEPLDEFIALEPDKWNEADFLDHLLEGNVRFNGVTYGVPMYTSSIALYYNKKLLDSAGIRPPGTWDELIQAAAALTDPNHNIEGLELSANASFPAADWPLLLWQAGGEFASPDGTQLLFNSEAGVKAAQLLKEQVQEKKAFFFYPQGASDSRFRNGSAAMYMNSSSPLSTFTYHPGLEFGVVPLPAGPGGAASQLSSSNNYIIKSTPVKEKAAWDFLMWLSSPKITAQIAPEWISSIPIRKSGFKQQAWLDALREEPNLQVFADAYTTGKFLPYQTNYVDTLDVLNRHLKAMLEGTESPQQAIEHAYEESRLNVKSWLDE